MLIVLPFFVVSAQAYKLEGTIGGKYPIVVELEEYDDGFISGRYAYKSTLEKNGEGECSWLSINPSYENPTGQWDIRDCKPEHVETWKNVRFNGNTLTAKMTNIRGKSYTVSASVVATPSAIADLTSYFKQHIGDYVYDFDMFHNQEINRRLDKLMPNGNFDLMQSYYQTQTPIEYTEGMFWASGFMAHQCCYPAVVWSYDSNCNSFYVWIRKNGQDYWWSESGTIPYKFRELVNEKY